MKIRTLTVDALTVIRSRMATDREWKDTSTPSKIAGMRDVSLSDDVVARLEACAFPQETISETIIRLIAVSDSKGRMN